MPAEGGARLGELVHALRTPLTIVEGFADALVQRGETMTPEDRADHLARIGEAAREMRDLLDATQR